MRKEIIIIKSIIRVEVDERVEDCENIKDAIEKGCFKYLDSELDIRTENGEVLGDKGTIEQVKEAIKYGLEERG